jgi:DNA-binding NarL/FixJ family response regulator
MARTKVLLIEDNRLLREGIAANLDAHGGFEVIAVEENGETLAELARSGQPPDVVLLDLGLEKADSLQLMGVLRNLLPEAHVIAMDILPDQVDIVEFVEAGGAGFILKSASLDEFVDTIQDVARGEKVLPAVMTTSLFTQIVEAAVESGKGIPDSAIVLTSREKQVVDLIAMGLSNKEIATKLHIATHTVKSHVHNILEKLSSRLQIAAFAHRRKS